MTAHGVEWQLSVPYSDFAGHQQTLALLSLVPENDDVAGPWRIERAEQVRRGHESPSVDSPMHPGPIRATDTAESTRIDSKSQRAGVRNEPVVDLWGNPVGSKRKRR